MLVGTDHFRCPRCGEVKPRTVEHFYFDRDGQVTGYCKSGGCHRSWWRDYYAGRSEWQRRRDRLRAREWHRLKRGTRPDLNRVTP